MVSIVDAVLTAAAIYAAAWLAYRAGYQRGQRDEREAARLVRGIVRENRERERQCQLWDRT